MSHRIDIELTSHREDGSWTWRAAGARQPKGIVGASLLPESATPGDVVRAEVESGIEGMEVVAVVPTKTPRKDQESNRIEVVGPRRSGPDVSVHLASGSRRRRERSGPERSRPRERRGAGGEERGGRLDSRRRSPGSEGGPSGRGEGGARRPGPARERRPAVSMTHRNAALGAMRPEEVPVAEQLLRGGLPAVRQALDEQNAKARQEGRPEVPPEALMATAERLVPLVNLAAWKDRATATQAAGRDVRLRELRAVVAASRTVVLDQEGRGMARVLQEALDQRVTALRQEWLDRIVKSLDNGRVLDAVRASARPPEPSARCPAELAVRLAEAAGQAMTSDLAVDEWLDLLAAVVDSPVRRSVRPSGIPEDDEARNAALRAAGSVPDLARQLGLPVPPPPRRSRVKDRVGGAGAGARRGGAAPTAGS